MHHIWLLAYERRQVILQQPCKECCSTLVHHEQQAGPVHTVTLCPFTQYHRQGMICPVCTKGRQDKQQQDTVPASVQRDVIDLLTPGPSAANSPNTSPQPSAAKAHSVSPRPKKRRRKSASSTISSEKVASPGSFFFCACFIHVC